MARRKKHNPKRVVNLLWHSVHSKVCSGRFTEPHKAYKIL